MKTQKSILAILLTLLMVFMSACGGQPVTDTPSEPTPPAQDTPSPGDTDNTEKKLKIGFVTAAGGVGDESLTDMVYGGIVDAVETIGADFDYVEPHSAADFTPMFKEFAQDGTYDLIIGVGYECAEPIKELAPLYPDQYFLAVDTAVPDLDNVACIVFNRAEQGYIVGLPTAYLTSLESIRVSGQDVSLPGKEKTIGCIIGTDAMTIVESQIGLYAACKFFDPEIKILTGVVGAWTDSAKANEIALSMYADGASIIWQNAGNGGKGIFSAAADMDGYSTGWNVAQHTMDPDHILFSVIKSMGRVAGEWLKEFASTGTFMAGINSYGYATGGYELEYSPNFEPPQAMVDAVNKGLELLETGQIVIPLTWEELEAFNATYTG